MKEIRLGRSGKVALVDDGFEIPEKGSFVLASNGYPKFMRYTGRRRPGGSCIYEEIYLHHLVIGRVGGGMEVDHINRDKLDAQSSNLRICRRMENAQNMSQRKGNYRGVHRRSKTPKNGKIWAAQITCNRKTYSLGFFTSEIEAAMIYNQAAIRLHGEYAYLNEV